MEIIENNTIEAKIDGQVEDTRTKILKAQHGEFSSVSERLGFICDLSIHISSYFEKYTIQLLNYEAFDRGIVIRRYEQVKKLFSEVSSIEGLDNNTNKIIGICRSIVEFAVFKYMHSNGSNSAHIVAAISGLYSLGISNNNSAEKVNNLFRTTRKEMFKYLATIEDDNYKNLLLHKINETLEPISLHKFQTNLAEFLQKA